MPPLNSRPTGFPYPTPQDPNLAGWDSIPQSLDIPPEASQGLDIPQLPPRPQMAVPSLRLPQPPSRLELEQNPVVPARQGVSWTGGKSLGTEEALAGLKASQTGDLNPFGPMELNRLAHRDPNSVQPGSNAYWQNMLDEQEADHRGIEGIQQKALEGISGAIAATHPAVQFGLEGDARRRAMPQVATGRAQLASAQAAARSRMNVGDAELQGRVQTGRYSHLDTIMQAIRGIQSKANVSTEDQKQLLALRSLYDIMAKPLTGATFEEATQDYEQ